eukprot:GDKJ01024203.1.p1 GENE.GDKJ01024203.1~~GDKJ01024203.1.p1  ORF type:complete len:345 (-),score=70.39 GDKJ01024203.1:80-1114(-)
MSILCTGGAGYIGSHTVISLVEAGFDVIIADNFCNSSAKVLMQLEKILGKKIPFVEVDFTNYASTDALFRDHSIKGVIHFAALKVVGESLADPLRYYQNNMLSLMNVIKAMNTHNVRNFVFSSSATVYRDCHGRAVTEDDPLGPCNPYGQTKLMAEQICTDIATANPNFHCVLLRYFNPVGNHPSGLMGESPFLPSNILPFIQQVAVGRRTHVSIFGDDWPTPDGTGVRDFLHVLDLADGHVASMKFLLKKGNEETKRVHIYNLGGGKGTSVLELIQYFEKASGRPVPFKSAPRRAGDLANVIADPSRANKELEWSVKRSVMDACVDAWKWQSQHPNGWDDVQL